VDAGRRGRYASGVSAPTSPARVRILVCAVGVLAIAVYANTLEHGFAWDDPRVIVDNAAAHDPGDWRRIFGTPSWFMEGESTTVYRPLATWTFAVSHALHDGRPFGYHVANVLLHAVVAMLLVLLALAAGSGLPAAALGGALFAVHPIHTEVVANGVGRAELLAAAFALGALWLALLADRRRHAGVLRAGCVLAYALALLSKEHAIAVLVLVPLTDLLVTDGGSARRFLAHLRGARLACYAGLVATTAAYLALRVAALGGLAGSLAVGGRLGASYNPTVLASPLLRVLTALGVQARAVGLLLWPFHLSADYSYQEIPVATGLGEPAVLAGILVAAGLVAGFAVAWRRRPVLAFWLGLALAPWLVVSNLVFPIGTIFGERLLYLPSAGACMLLATGLVGAARRTSVFVAGGLAAALLVAWSVRTVTRNPVWASDLVLAQATVADAPRSVNAHASLGRVYIDLGRDQDALAELETAARLLAAHPGWPERLDVLYQTALVRQRRGETEAALGLYREIVARDPGYFPAWIDLGALANRLGRHEEALAAAERAAAIRPDLPNVDLVRGFALRGLGRRREALAAFRAVLARVPGAPDALLGAGAAAYELGDFPEAVREFQALVAAAPSQDAYRGLVLSLRQAGRAEEAAQVAARARARFPDDPTFRAE
jgi:tetratricopeptide (TPR) repeat protein